MDERFTNCALRVMKLASNAARRLNADFVAPEHILLGLVAEGTGAAANALKALGVDPGRIRHEVEKLVFEGPIMVTMGPMRLTRHATKVVEYAVEEAGRLNRDYVGTEHLLLGLLRQDEGVAAQVLLNVNLRLKEVRYVVLRLPTDQLDAASEVKRAAKASDGKTSVLNTDVRKNEKNRRLIQMFRTAALWTLGTIFAVLVAVDVLTGNARARQRALQEFAQTHPVLVCVVGSLSLGVAAFCISVRFAGPGSNLWLHELSARERAAEMTGSTGRYGTFEVNPEYFAHLRQRANELVPQFQGRYSWLNIPAGCFGAIGGGAFLALDNSSSTVKISFTLSALTVAGLAFGIGWLLFSDQCYRFVVDTVKGRAKNRR
jgi:hypothetical protein